jgi:hypothetical protein
MTILPKHLDAAVSRMMEKLLQLGQTVRSDRGPRALKAKREQEVLLEAWDMEGRPEEVVELLKDTWAKLQ